MTCIRSFRLGAVSVLAASMLFLSGCSASNATQGADGGVTDIEIAVTQWPSLVFSVPYHVAMEKGFFKKVGINVTGVITTQGGGTDVRAILAGNLAFGEAATSAVANAYLQGAPLKIVGAGVQAVGDIVWVAPKDSSLNSVKDVSGHSASYTNPGSVTQSVLALSLDRAGIDVKQVEMKATGGVGEGISAMEAGGVDSAIWSEPLFSAAPDKYKLLWRASDLIPEYQQTVIVTSPDLVKKNPTLVRNFLKARAEGLQYMIDHPDEAGEIWAERGKIDPAAAKSAIQALLAANEWGVGFSGPGLTTAEEGMHIAGVLKPKDTVPWSDFLTQDFLPKGVDKISLP